MKRTALKRFPWPYNMWGEQIPPNWLRPFVSWRLLYFINDHCRTCWSGMVSWKLGGDSSWSVRRECLFGDDYCGKYDNRATDRDAAMRDFVAAPDVMVNFSDEEIP